MTVLFESNLGYVNCDIDGEGYNRVTVSYDSWSPEDSAYIFVRTSLCYGDLEVRTSREGAVKLLEENEFLVATLRARKVYARFVRKMKKPGRIPLEERETAEPLFNEAEYEDAEGCDCPSCVQTEMDIVPAAAPEPSQFTIRWLDDVNDIDIIAPRLSDLMVIDPGYRIVDGGLHA